MSANIRATPPPWSSGRHGSTANVLASGSAIMSDSSMALKPVIEEPSKPIPPAKASSSCSELMLNDFSDPRMSVNQRRMKRMPRSWTTALTSSFVCGRSAGSTAMGAQPSRSSEQPAIAPGLQRQQPLPQVAAALGELVLDADGRALLHAALDDAAVLELLETLREQPIGERGDGVADLREAHGAALQEHVDDRPAPALADQLDGLVQARAALDGSLAEGPVEGRDGDAAAAGLRCVALGGH